MFKRIKNYILKFIYRKTIVSVQIIDKASHMNNKNFRTIRTLNIATQAGHVNFVFKEDTFVDKDLFYKVFFVYTEHDENIKAVRPDIVNKGMLVIRIVATKINYEVLTEVLLDLYLKTMNGYDEYTLV